MKCIYCGSETKVTNSRPQKRTNKIWRRRQCLSCGGIFSTEEQAVTENSLLVQQKNRLEPFSREKLLISIYDSLRHRKTAVADAAALTETIWGRLYPKISDATLKRENIIQTTHEVLKRFDAAAATSYLAFHPLQ